MTNLLERLTEEAATIADSALPSQETLRPVLGSLIKHVEDLESKVLGSAAPAVEQVQADAVKAVEQATAPADPSAQPAPAVPAIDYAKLADALKTAMGG